MQGFKGGGLPMGSERARLLSTWPVIIKHRGTQNTTQEFNGDAAVRKPRVAPTETTSNNRFPIEIHECSGLPARFPAYTIEQVCYSVLRARVTTQKASVFGP